MLDTEIHEETATEKGLEVFLREPNDFVEEFSRILLGFWNVEMYFKTYSSFAKTCK